MAIKPGYKTFTFDGQNSATYGAYITGSAVYNAPERDVEMIKIPGRNGAFVQDNGRFENIEVTYPAGIYAESQEDFAQALSDLRNMLASRKGYVRLTDEYNPEEYRMAVYKSGLDVDPVAFQRAGEFTITFDCKPQRWLTSGEVPVKIGEYQDIAGEDNAPYLFRSSPQFSDGYDTEMDKLVGGTVAWNQLVQNGNFASTSNWYASGASLSASNNKLTVTASGASPYFYQTNVPVKGHKFFVTATISADANNIGSYAPRILFNWDAGAGKVFPSLTKGTKATLSTIITTTNATDNLNIYCGVNAATSGDVFTIENVMCIDLTQMFGSTIADYIYTLESGTAGAGVAWFKSLFPKPYYAYNAGELKSVSGLVSHDMTGFNQWDEEWEVGSIDSSTGANEVSADHWRSKNHIPVVPDATYYIFSETAGHNAMRMRYYDADKGFIGIADGNGITNITSNYTFKTPDNCYYVRFAPATATIPSHKICINLSWDGSRDGEYEPYELHSYPLDTDLTLRGIPKLDANNSLYYDGDVWKADGTVTRKYGIVDLGTLTWSSAGVGDTYYATISDLKWETDGNVVVNAICQKYVAVTKNYFGSNPTVQGVYRSDSGHPILYFRDSTYTTAAAFKTAMSGVYLVYELATPTTESADAFESIQTVSPLGTEEYVSTSIVPVGHNTKYGMNPNVLDNPTLFESSPMLEIYGYGTVSFNSYDIEVLSAELGEIKISDTANFPSGTGSRIYGITLDTSNLVSGDSIYVIGSGMLQGSVKNTDGSKFIRTSVTSTSGVISTNVVRVSNFVRFQINPDFSTGFVYGTASTITCSATFQYYKVDGVTHTTETISASYAYDGDSTLTITVTRTGTLMQNTVRTAESCYMPALYGDSSKIVVPAPVYIDCDLGEAYGYESGELVSYNNIVTIPADLPKLASGANTITYDNTITELKVQPRWWKV